MKGGEKIYKRLGRDKENQKMMLHPEAHNDQQGKGRGAPIIWKVLGSCRRGLPNGSSGLWQRNTTRVNLQPVGKKKHSIALFCHLPTSCSGLTDSHQKPGTREPPDTHRDQPPRETEKEGWMFGGSSRTPAHTAVYYSDQEIKARYFMEVGCPRFFAGRDSPVLPWEPPSSPAVQL